MATLVSFHAHPDDECIACGGVIRKAADAGHRVVLVIATRGEEGEIPEGLLADGEELWQRRVAETQASADILGAQRVEFLGYRDSGMMGTPANDRPGSFWTTPVEEAAQRLAGLLRAEQADVLTCYDKNGSYGHPDHIQVHRVGIRAAELAGTPRVYQSTINRDHVERSIRQFAAQDAADGVEFAGTGPGHVRPAGVSDHRRSRRHAVPGRQAACDAGARQPDQRAVVLPGHAGRPVPGRVRHRVVHPGWPGPGHHRDRPALNQATLN